MISIAAIIVVLVSIVVGVDAHGYLKSPRSRNFFAYQAGAYYGGNSSTPTKEYCPHCLNKGGTLGQCGVVENRNYDHPLNAMGGALVPTVQATYTSGSQIDVEIVLTTMHKGHFLFYVCPTSSSGSVPAGDCFQNNPLAFVQDLLYGAPKDPNYPYRAYVPPASYGKLVTDSSGISGTLFRYRLQLPSNVVGDHVLLQWHYLTGNSCIYPGYSQYRWPSDWPSPISGAGLCASVSNDGSGFPEQFWNCADVRIVNRAGTYPAPTPQARKPTKPLPRKPPTPKPVRQPISYRATTSPNLVVGTCGDGKVGNSICPDHTLCCSKWGWCGSSTAFCGNKAARSASLFAESARAKNSTEKNTSSVKNPTLRPVHRSNPRPTSRPSQRPVAGGRSESLRTRAPHRPSQRKPSRSQTRLVGTCGLGNAGNGICSNSTLCCSKWGWCGSGNDFCGDRVQLAPTVAPVPVTQPVPLTQVPPYPIPPPAPVGASNCGSVSDVMSVNFGYYQSWAIYRQEGCNRVHPKDINVAGNHYTHIAYSFAGINSTDHLAPYFDDYTGEVPLYAEFNALKSTNPGLKTSIAVGGWTFNEPGATQTRFSDIAASASRRATFAASVLAFLDKYDFDGIDFDWEYPGDTSRGGKAVDIQNFPLLLKAVRDAAASAGKSILITLAMSVSTTRLSTGYQLSALAQQVDFFNLMAYDIHGAWDSPQVVGSHTDLAYIKNSVQYLLQNGVPSNKMLLGLAAYGHTFLLADTACITPGCAFTGGGPGGCAGATGNMAYFTIDEYIQSNNYNSLKFNPSTSSMELVISGNVWITFDNAYTLGLKAAYAASMCMGGTMWWAVDLLASPLVISTSSTPSVSTSGLGSQPTFPISLVGAPQPSETPQRAPTPNPVRPPSPQTKTPVESVPVTPTSGSDYVVSTASRCGVSELDARGNCGQVCQTQSDCSSGQWCWSVYPNYCGSKTVSKCADLTRVSNSLRCGVSELQARELCGAKCESDGDCNAGQKCFSVQSNLCDC